MPAPKADAATTLAGVLTAARRQLSAAGIDDPALEARMIVEHFTGTDRDDAIRAPERPDRGRISLPLIDDALARRLAGEPVHRIFGYRDFYGLRLKLSPETLEPRPDTETLVDAMLPFLREIVQRDGHCRVLDLGTGTGAIALALASQAPGGGGDGDGYFGRSAGDGCRQCRRCRPCRPLHSASFRLVFSSFREISCNRLKPALYTQ